MSIFKNEDSKFKLAVNDFMDSLLDGVISDLRKQNPEYKACREYEKDNVDKFEEVLDRLQKEDRDFIKKHEMNIFNIFLQ